MANKAVPGSLDAERPRAGQTSPSLAVAAAAVAMMPGFVFLIALGALTLRLCVAKVRIRLLME